VHCVQVLEQITGRRLPQVFVDVFESCWQWGPIDGGERPPEVGLPRQVWCEVGETYCAKQVS